MKILTSFWNTLIKSLVSPAYYNEILKKKIGFSFRFYFGFFLLYASIITISLTLTLWWPLHGFLMILPDELKTAYPEELIITIQDGKVVTNVEEPYYIPLESFKTIIEDLEGRVLGASTDQIINFLVIDTQADISNIEDYQTLALLTETHFAYLNETHKIEAISLRDVDELVINQENVDNMIGIVSPYLNYIMPLGILITLVWLAIVMPFLYLVYLAVFAVIVMFAGKFMSLNLEYRQSFQLGLHLIVMPITFLLVFRHLLGIGMPIRFLFSLIMLGWTIAVLSNLKKTRPQVS